MPEVGRLVGDKTRYTNRLGNALKQYYPQVLQWFEQRDTVAFLDFLTRWPTLTQAKRTGKTTLVTFFNAHNVRVERVIEARLCAIKSASPLTRDMAVITAYQLQTEVLVEQLLRLLPAMTRRSLQRLPSYPIMPCCLSHSPALAWHWRRGCWLALVKTASATLVQSKYNNTQALPR